MLYIVVSNLLQIWVSEIWYSLLFFYDFNKTLVNLHIMGKNIQLLKFFDSELNQFHNFSRKLSGYSELLSTKSHIQ
jgi:predicted nucleic-acid-binding Zn-ribbon protein